MEGCVLAIYCMKTVDRQVTVLMKKKKLENQPKIDKVVANEEGRWVEPKH